MNSISSPQLSLVPAADVAAPGGSSGTSCPGKDLREEDKAMDMLLLGIAAPVDQPGSIPAAYFTKGELHTLITCGALTPP